MKTLKPIIAATLLSASVLGAQAWQSATYHISDMTVKQEHGLLKIDMTVHPKDYKLSYNKQLEVVPVLKSIDGNDSIVFPSFTVAGRNAYYNTLRSSDSEKTIMRSGHGEPMRYSESAEWQPWMDYSRLDLQAHPTGCCGVPAGDDTEQPVAELDMRPVTFSPKFHYEVPVAEESKRRRIEGKAYVNFPVNRTEIFPDYMVNPQELRKIMNSVDSVKYNKDATVKSITLTGYASPEGPYANNVRLAKGRTEAVKEYVRKQYTFPASIFHTNSVPEDWEGLRDSVANSILEDRQAILNFIDNGNVPIQKRNDELARRFPTSYKFLLKNVYPSLRHTNYAIDYEIKSYTDINEILAVYETRPDNLSMNEFFLAAKQYPVGSVKYDEIFNKAVIYHPDNYVANLNAANSSMNEGDYKRARMLLNRISDKPSAIYALALLDALEGNYDSAEQGMNNARQAGVAEADEAIEEIKRVRTRKNQIRYFEEK